MFHKLASYPILPREITFFERTYLERTNKIALFYFALHIPVYTLIAWVNGTGPLLAVGLTSLALAGPWLASKVLGNPRHVSATFGVTAMYVGALLVHFGRGLWTIEMHFYFFVSLALLAVFANPAVVLTGAVTVTLHHLVGWALFPESVFNYDAPITSVLVHAAFVVIESVAACYVARSFFDNVIGLEKIVAERTVALDGMNRDIHLILDNVSQGLLTVQMDGALSAEHSRVVADWFGKPVAGQRVWDYFAASDTTYAAWLRVGWDTLADDILPAELVLAQLPFRLVSKERTYELSYRLIRDEGGVERVLFVVNDATERLAREQADAVQRETIDVFRFVSRDRQGFVDFMLETSSQVAQLALPETPEGDAGARRIVHTIKGNSALFAVSSVAATCEAVEHRAAENESVITPADRAEVTAAWNAAEARVRDFLGEAKVGIVEIEEAEIQADGDRRERRRLRPRSRAARRVAERAHTPAAHALRRAGQVARAPARTRGDRGGGRRRPVAAAEGAPLLLLVRADPRRPQRRRPRPPRGAEPPPRAVDVRGGRAAGRRGRRQRPGHRLGPVLARATSLGLPTATRADLVEALFSDGLSTRDEVTEISGRGVGLAAVREACAELGATVSVETGAHGGTKFAFTFPKDAFWSAPASRAA